MAAIDVTAFVPQITDVIGGVLLVGAAILAVNVALNAFRFVKQMIREDAYGGAVAYSPDSGFSSGDDSPAQTASEIQGEIEQNQYDHASDLFDSFSPEQKSRVSELMDGTRGFTDAVGLVEDGVSVNSVSALESTNIASAVSWFAAGSSDRFNQYEQNIKDGMSHDESMADLESSDKEMAYWRAQA